ncbi:MAG: hypothetical protein QM535_20060 [Limnohabitans sp.]|nr:hypothetical protein [Limnohabitans sp.]
MANFNTTIVEYIFYSCFIVYCLLRTYGNLSKKDYNFFLLKKLPLEDKKSRKKDWAFCTILFFFIATAWYQYNFNTTTTWLLPVAGIVCILCTYICLFAREKRAQYI